MPRLIGPQFLFLQTNQRCNLRCTHCQYWLLNDDNSEEYLGLKRRRQLVNEFASIGGKNVVTCGGEPMLDLEPYFDLMQACRTAKVGCMSVINGTRVQSRETALRMMTQGPSEITVSLDHWNAAEHDRLRGVDNSHLMAVRAIKLLQEARAMTGNNIPIYVMTILSEDTWPTLDQFFEFALDELQVDKLKLNIMQPTFQGRSFDHYFEGARVSDVAACMTMIRKCDLRWHIPRNPKWLDDVEMYLQSVNSCSTRLLGWGNPGTSQAICNSYDRNIMIDLYGRARLCFSNTFPAVQLNTPGDLTRYWHETSLPIREAMQGCKQFCGISHSVRASSSLVR
jgi:pyruvate-formate lyase-activating enzyme